MIDRNTSLMLVVDIMAQRSSCLRGNVGCVISLDGRVISTGYNGQPRPYNKKCAEKCDTSKPCQISNHAEINALNALRKILKPKKFYSIMPRCILYVSTSPCIRCAEIIQREGIKRVIYKDEYRDTSGLEYLTKHKVTCIKYAP